MTYEKMTGEINLEELEVQAEEVTEASASLLSWLVKGMCPINLLN